jgi:5-methylcytosine-specific restriction endonuclease McrA
MSSRAHRWEAAKSPIAQHHGGSAAAARAAVKAAQTERLKEFQRAREIVRQQMAERTPEAVEKPASAARRLRPRARLDAENHPSLVRWNCRKRRHYAPRGIKAEVWRPMDWKEAEARRLILIEVQAGLCALCGEPISEADRGKDALRPTIEHVIPRDLGGDNYRNLLIAHSQCNAMKSNDLPTGCEVIWLLAVNAWLSLLPGEMQEAFCR